VGNSVGAGDAALKPPFAESYDQHSGVVWVRIILVFLAQVLLTIASAVE